MRIAMIGTGYVGLVSGACFAEFGHDVACVDIDANKIARLRGGEIPIYEPGLEELVARNVEAGRLSFSTDLAAAVSGRDCVFIAVGTPPRPEDGHADLSHVYTAADQIARAIDGYTVIIDKSTVPVGTARAVMAIATKALPRAEWDVVSNPEFLREGAAIEDFMKPDRVVVGADSERARSVMRELYAPLSDKGVPILMTGVESAEIVKYATNAFLATKVTFINEMADLCEKVGGDVEDVALGLGLDDRIGSKFLRAGPGYGGSCFPKDTLALAKTAESVGAPTRIVEAVIAKNHERKGAMADRVEAALGGDLTGKTVAVLGLTFKPDTDDMRESPSIDVVASLIRKGAHVRAYDPQGMEHAKSLINGAVFCADAHAALDGASALVLVTEWAEFAELDLAQIKTLMANPLIVDLRNLFDPAAVSRAGFSYLGIGRSGRATAAVSSAD
ncbi:MAG: UDP-glucose/GDP-mannose dehydrogenase family protein [Alphaproteobacteria bacterium]|nr:UDP-glucose/GDP-mannose dehydrogenase family protein [Alphaproteobacteria bacterium]